MTRKAYALLTIPIIIFLSLFATEIQAKEVPNVSGDYHDELKLLEPSTINNLKEINDNLSNSKDAMGARIMVITIEDLEGQPAFDYSVDLFNEIGIGSEKERNGILLMLAKEGTDSSDRMHIEVRVGHGLEGILNDGKIGRMLDNTIMPSIKGDNINSGINDFIIQTTQEIEKEYDISVIGSSVSFDDSGNYQDVESKFVFITGLAIVVLLFIGVVSYAITGDSTILYIVMIIVDVLLDGSTSSSNSSNSSKRSSGGETRGGGAGRSS